MMRNPEDGMYYFRAGLLCSALGWNVKTKLGLQLKEIHQPIPDYKEKLQFSMDRFVLMFSLCSYASFSPLSIFPFTRIFFPFPLPIPP